MPSTWITSCWFVCSFLLVPTICICAENSLLLLDSTDTISDLATATLYFPANNTNQSYASFPSHETILSVSLSLGNDTTSHVHALIMDDTGHVLGTVIHDPPNNTSISTTINTMATACFDVLTDKPWWLTKYAVAVAGTIGTRFHIRVFAVNVRLPVMGPDTTTILSASTVANASFLNESTAQSYVRTYRLTAPTNLDGISLLEIRLAAIGDLSIEQPAWFHIRPMVDSRGLPRECPSPDSILEADSTSSRLTFDQYGVFVLSPKSSPPLVAGASYLIGIWKIKPTRGDPLFEGAPEMVFQQETIKRFQIRVVASGTYSASGIAAMFVLLPIIGAFIVVFAYFALVKKYPIWRPLPWSPTEALANETNQTKKQYPHGWKGITTRLRATRFFRPRPPNHPYAFPWHLTMIAVAFFVPAFQYVWSQRAHMLESGNRDICFYNDRCYRPSPWHDLPFNNMISNVPYIGLGLVFITFVALDEAWLRPDVANGLFYAIGIAIIGEGIFSTTYHICPTPVIYQFDTACMFAIAIMCILSLNQTGETDPADDARGHKGVTLRSVKVFLFVYVVLLLLNAGGTASSSSRDGIIVAICIIQLIWIIYLVYNFYMASEIRRKLSYAILAYYIMCLILTIIFAVGKGGPAIDSIANLLLIQLVFALLMTTCASLVTRRHLIAGPPDLLGDKRLRLARAILICAIPGFLGAGAFALGYSFFSRHTSNKAVLPHQSRNGNSDCVSSILDFHDIWHTLSAIGLFFLFILFYMINPPHRRDTSHSRSSSSAAAAAAATTINVAAAANNYPKDTRKSDFVPVAPAPNSQAHTSMRTETSIDVPITLTSPQIVFTPDTTDEQSHEDEVQEIPQQRRSSEVVFHLGSQ